MNQQKHSHHLYARIQKVLSAGVQLRQRFFPFLFVDEGRENQNTTKIGP